MKIVEVKDYAEMSEKAAQYVIAKVKAVPNLHLGMATGGTPKGLYKKLIEDHVKHGTSYRAIKTFNLDEYVGLPPHHPNSYSYYMREHLFHHITIKQQNTHIPSGMATDLQEECQRYEKLIDDHGIDLQILGIGANGHIGFNEPGTSFQSKTHVVELATSTKKANARFFSSTEEVPSYAITMGIASIMRSKEILLVASGASKQHAMKQLLQGEVTEQFPASIIRQHPNVTIIADRDALMGTNVSSTYIHL